MPNNYPLEKRFYDKVIILVDVPCHFWIGAILDITTVAGIMSY